MKTALILCRSLCLVIVAACILSGCKKNNALPDQVAKLTNGTWKLNTTECQNGAGTWINIPLQPPAMGATISFNTDNTFASGLQGVSAHGMWKFSADYSQLFTTNQSSGVSQTYTVYVLSGTTLQIGGAITQTISGTTYYAERDTFVH